MHAWTRSAKPTYPPDGSSIPGTPVPKHESLPVSTRPGNLGDTRSIGGGMSEMRIDVGAGYPVCLCTPSAHRDHLALWRQQSTQAEDIARATFLADAIE